MFDTKKIEAWTDGLLFGRHDIWPVPLTWQYDLWQKCLLTWPPSHRMLNEVHRFQKGLTVPRRDVSSQLGTGALWLFLAMMDRFWRSKEINFDIRAHVVESAGIPGKHTAGSIRLQSSKIGLRKATETELRRQVAALKKSANKFLAKNKEELLYAEIRDFTLLTFPVPDVIDNEVADGSERSYHDYFAKRMGYFAGTEYLRQMAELSTNSQVRRVAQEMLSQKLGQRGGGSCQG